MIAAWDGPASWDGFGHWEYLALMGACVLITLPLEFVFSARVYRRLPLLLKALLPVVVVFAVWDIVAIARDHWTYDPRFVTGIDLGILPLEELVFFLVIPVCALLSYEAVGTVIGWTKRRTADRQEAAKRTSTARRMTADHPTNATRPIHADPHPPDGGETP